MRTASQALSPRCDHQQIHANLTCGALAPKGSAINLLRFRLMKASPSGAKARIRTGMRLKGRARLIPRAMCLVNPDHIWLGSFHFPNFGEHIHDSRVVQQRFRRSSVLRFLVTYVFMVKLPLPASPIQTALLWKASGGDLEMPRACSMNVQGQVLLFRIQHSSA